MIRDSVMHASAGAQIIATGLLAVCGLRFAVSGVLWAIEVRAPKLPQLAAPPKPAPSSTAVATVSAAPAGSVVPAGLAVRVMLSITAGPPRSDVYVNGVKVGNSPFLGEVSCKTGEGVKVEIVPARGALITQTRRCVPGTLRIGD